MSAVIDRKAFDRIKSYINYAKESNHAKIVFGGNFNDEIGYFIEPTCVEVTDINSKLLKEVFTLLFLFFFYRFFFLGNFWTIFSCLCLR